MGGDPINGGVLEAPIHWTIEMGFLVGGKTSWLPGRALFLIALERDEGVRLLDATGSHAEYYGPVLGAACQDSQRYREQRFDPLCSEKHRRPLTGSSMDKGAVRQAISTSAGIETIE